MEESLRLNKSTYQNNQEDKNSVDSEGGIRIKLDDTAIGLKMPVGEEDRKIEPGEPVAPLIRIEEPQKTVAGSGIQILPEKTGGLQQRKTGEFVYIVRRDPESLLNTDKKNQARKDIIAYEKKNKDYATFGIAFDLAHVKATTADSKDMRKLKDALTEYLRTRREIFQVHDLEELQAKDLVEDGVRADMDLLPEDERERMGDALDRVWAAIKKYQSNHNKTIATARGRARYRQVLRIRDQLIKDDARFYVSKERRQNMKTLDNSYRVADRDSRDFADRFVNGTMPTYQKAIYWSDMIDLKRMAYRDMRREQRAKGELPGYCRRIQQWWGTAFKVKGYQLMTGYNNVGGFIDRTLGGATMIAANTLELGGKVAIKAPLKILSYLFNGASWLIGSKKRWRMKFSLRDNWKSVDDGRKIFRRYLKGACVIPTAILETLTRGVPALFGHKFKSGVYKRTTKWTGDILNDVKNVVKSAGYLDKGRQRRAIENEEVDLENNRAEKYLDDLENLLEFEDRPLNDVLREDDRKSVHSGDEDTEAPEEENRQNLQQEQHAPEEHIQEEHLENGQAQQIPQEQQNQEQAPAMEVRENHLFSDRLSKTFSFGANLVRNKVGTVEKKYILLSPKEKELLYTEDFSRLSMQQLTELKDLCIRVLTENSDIGKEKISFLPLELLLPITKGLDRDYPDLALMKANSRNAMDELDEALDLKTIKEVFALFPKKEEEKEASAYRLLGMREFAQLAIARNAEATLTNSRALDDFGPFEMAELSSAMLAWTENMDNQGNEKTEETRREAAVTVLTMTTGLSNTKFLMRPMKDLERFMRITLDSLDDRKKLRQEIQGILDKEEEDFRNDLRKFDVKTELINDTEAELLSKDIRTLTKEEWVRLVRASERVLSQKGGADMTELDRLPLSFKQSLAKKIWESKDTPDELSWQISYEISQFINSESLAELMYRIDEEELDDADGVLMTKANVDREVLHRLPSKWKQTLAKKFWEGELGKEEFAREAAREIDQYIKENGQAEEVKPGEEPSEAEIAARRDLYVYTLSRAGLAGEAKRSDFDRVPLEELKKAASFAAMIGSARYAELEPAELKDYRTSLAAFLKGYAGLSDRELSLLPTKNLTAYTRQMIENLTVQNALVPVAYPLKQEDIEEKLTELTGDAFANKEFDTLQTKEARLELKELIAYEILKETEGDRDELLSLTTEQLYNLYQQAPWREKEAESLSWIIGNRKDLLPEHQEKSELVVRPGAEWSKDTRKLLDMISDLASGLGVTDEMGNAIASEKRVLEVFRKNAALIAKLANGETATFEELLYGSAKEEIPLFGGFQKMVMELTGSLAKLKEEDPKLKEAAWDAKTVEALLSTESGGKLFSKADQKVSSFIEKEVKRVQKLIKEATQELFLPAEEESGEQMAPQSGKEEGIIRESGKEESSIRVSVKEENRIIESGKEENRIIEPGKEENKITEAAPEIITNEEEWQEELPNPLELDRNLEEEKEKARHKAERENELLGIQVYETEDVRKLHRMRDDAYGKGSVQGRFLQASLSRYYEKASPESKRLMISEILRSMKPKRRYAAGRDKTRNGLYLQGFIKGAGPVMQKLIQGIPEKLIRPEFTRAIQSAKSELRHLPDEYVEAKLEEIAKTSQKKVKSFTKVSVLGAASVAETFLCRVEYEDGAKEEVVVKLLRPDAEEKIREETGILTAIAGEEDQTGVMESSINSHITEIKKELDFTRECKNTEKGKAYETASLDKGTVKTVRVNRNFKPKKDAFVMDKAEGESCDRYLAGVMETIRKSLSLFEKQGSDSSDEDYLVTAKNANLWLEKKNALVDELEKLEVRKKNIIKLAEQWVQEALFGKLFHHGDLHSGNLMINDRAVTVLDYGNANVFSKEQVTVIVRMMASAMSGNTELFTQNLETLINLGKEKQEPIPEKNKEAFKKSLKEVFSLGSGENAGARIFVALQKAEAAGIRLPHEIQNFSRCEQRLENTVDEFNRVRLELIRAIRRLDHMVAGGETVFMHPVLSLQHSKNFQMSLEEKDPVTKHMSFFEKADADALTRELKKKGKGAVEEFEKIYLGVIKETYEAMGEDRAEKSVNELPEKIETIRRKYEEGVRLEDEVDRSMVSGEINEFISELEFHYRLPTGMLTGIGNQVAEALVDRDQAKMDEVINRLKDIPVMVRLMKEYKATRKMMCWDREGAIQTFVTDYVTYSEKMKKRGNFMVSLERSISPDTAQRIDMRGDIRVQFQTVTNLLEEYLEKDKKGNYVYGDAAKELEILYEKVEPITKKLKKKEKLTPEEEETCLDFKRVKFLVGSLRNIRRVDRSIRRELDRVFQEKSDLGKEMLVKFEAFRKAQDLHLSERTKKQPDMDAVQKAGEKRKAAEEDFLLVYRQYMIRELEKLRASEKKEPETTDINFVGIMENRVSNNQGKTLEYLGGLFKAGKYLKGDMKLELTEEQKKALEQEEEKAAKAAKKAEEEAKKAAKKQEEEEKKAAKAAKKKEEAAKKAAKKAEEEAKKAAKKQAKAKPSAKNTKKGK